MTFVIEYAGIYSAPRGRDFPSHRHTIWELVLYRRGNIRAPLGEKIYQARPGILLATPPGVYHAEIADTDYENVFVSIHAPRETQWPECSFDDERGTLSFLMSTMVDEWHQRQPQRETILELLLQQLNIYLQRNTKREEISSDESIVRQAETLFHQNWNRSLLMSDVARQIGVAPSTLRALFARRRGQSPQASLHQIRLQHALALLRDSTATIESIAQSCGFDSASHLSRHIKRATGKSPGKLRYKF